MRPYTALLLILTIALALYGLVVFGVVDECRTRWRVRQLHQLERGDVSEVSATVGDLGATNVRVRAAAARGLGLIGHADEVVVTRLVDLVERAADPRVASEAAWSLGQLRPVDARVVESLAAGLTHWNPDVRRYSAYSLAQLEEAAAPKLTDLVARLTDPSEAVVCKAVEALGACQDPDAIDDLVPLLENPSWAVRVEVILALVKLGPLSPEIAARVDEIVAGDSRIAAVVGKL